MREFTRINENRCLNGRENKVSFIICKLKKLEYEITLGDSSIATACVL